MYTPPVLKACYLTQDPSHLKKLFQIHKQQTQNLQHTQTNAWKLERSDNKLLNHSKPDTKSEGNCSQSTVPVPSFTGGSAPYQLPKRTHGQNVHQLRCQNLPKLRCPVSECHVGPSLYFKILIPRPCFWTQAGHRKLKASRDILRAPKSLTSIVGDIFAW